MWRERSNSTAKTESTLYSGHYAPREWSVTDVKLKSNIPALNKLFDRAKMTLQACVDSERAVLLEGGGYNGTWLESTASICTEVLSRYLPNVAIKTLETMLQNQRDDGLVPYKVTREGPSYTQLQVVSPIARAAWTIARLWDKDSAWVREVANRIGKFEHWVSRQRDTRGTGAVEAFCTYDTGRV